MWGKIIIFTCEEKKKFCTLLLIKGCGKKTKCLETVTASYLGTTRKIMKKLKISFEINISFFFLVLCSLPLPWFLFTLVFNKPVPVSAEGMVCSIVLLFLMLVLVFLSILLFNWKMTKFMGFSMFVFYFLFVIVTLGFEYDLWACPL